MSTSETSVAVATPTVKMPVMPLLLSVVVAVLLAVGGCGAVLYTLVRSGKLHTGLPTAAAATAATAVAVPVKILPLEPLLANLADADGHAYLRLGVTLQVADEPKKDKKDEKETKGPSPLEAGLRDSVLEVLGRETSSGLLAADGKERLKRELMAKFAERNADAKVHEIFFTDFLVQR